MSSIEELIAAIRSKPLTDVIVVGFVEGGDTVKHFYARLTTVYLEFARQLMVRCASIGQFDKLQLDVVQELSFDFAVEGDERYCISSISELVLATPHWDQYVTEIRVYFDDQSRLDKGIVKCGAFCMQGEDTLFLDPTNIFGIQLGKREAENVWVRENVGVSGPYSQQTWQIENIPPRGQAR